MKHTIDEVQLTDALKGIFIHVPEAPVINFEVNFRSGYQFTSEEKYEVPHLLEHLISGENKIYEGRKAVRRAMDKHGSYHNAITNYNHNHYVFEAPLFDAERMLDLQLAALSSPLFSADEFESGVSVVRDEISSRRNDYRRELSIMVDRALGITDILDYQSRFDRIENVTLEDVKSYYKASHTQKNSRFIVAGDLSKHRQIFEEKLKSGLGKLPIGEYWEFNETKFQRIDSPIHLVRDVPTTFYLIRFITKGYTSYKDSIVRKLMHLLLVDMWNSIIFGRGRDEGILYGIASGSGYDTDHSHFGFSGSVQNTNLQTVIKFIGEKLKEFKEGDFDDSLLEEAKVYKKGQFLRNYQASHDLLQWYSDDYTFDDSVHKLETYIPSVEAITKEDIVESANALFSDDIWGFGLLTNQGGELDTEAVRNILAESL